MESACNSVAILISWCMDREKAKLYFKDEVQRYQLVYMHCSTQNLEKDTISDIMDAVMEIAMRKCCMDLQVS